MTKINFEEILGEDERKQPRTQSKWSRQTSEAQPTVAPSYASFANYSSALEMYEAAYANKKRCESLYKAASDALDLAKEELLKITGHEAFEDERVKVEQVERKGSVEWKLVEFEHPEIKLDRYRKSKTVYWTVKLKPSVS